MIFEDTNIQLFHSINAFALKYPMLDQLVIFFADDLNTVFISFIVLLLIVQWKTYSLIFAKTLFMVLISLLLCDLVDYFYHHPRPFQLQVGHKLIGHGPSSSFPTQHTLTIVIIACSYLMAGFKLIGGIGLVLSLIVGLSRIFVGVHFPFDILGAFVIGFMLVLLVNYALKELAPRFRKAIPLLN
ncbi:phosphatase PAP2 family protein [Acinetobacter haemolyticus]|uniref:phosphatase PAP2 family protein n=1 Tax=Acinetobacter haemolyticus TaxID=29430 RepID=UPI001331EFED|nr:phosphatase PAP2 family protein [Acinetobacter haemolyticus]NAR16783.1 phosphatase PAP2 family protein [Acinetobacter haemolyticus]NAR34939.1 phosphatase PAP2 family protein [Acinetobacter haemolyticus]QHI19100.1 phosphatase PAP2 family protein [Acinetobacter haemolyticus]